ncbi:MAG: hypothetical protein FWD82_09770 [Defluviitaleaceae bacterium]|nr:hypothetical protein [Defluviitaleaceae bacterium]
MLNNILTAIIALGGIAGLFTLLIQWNAARIKNRPVVRLTDLTIDTKKVEIYIGEDVDGYYGAKSINEQIVSDREKKYVDLVTDPKKLNQTSLLLPNEHLIPGKGAYMFVNLCTKNSNVEDIILAFDVLNITLTIDDENKSIEELEINAAYSLRKVDKSFGGGLTIDVDLTKIPKFISPLEIPVAYAYTVGDESSLHVSHINSEKNRIKSKQEKNPSMEIDTKIQLLKPQARVGKYLGFSETSYLLKCKTSSSFFPYYYSIFLSLSNRMLNPPEQSDNKKLFLSKVKHAGKEIKHDFVKRKR